MKRRKKVFTRFKWSWNMLILRFMIAVDMQTLNNVYIWAIKCACVFQAYNVISRRINFGNECFRPNFWHWISLKIFIAESLKYIWLNFMFFKSEMVFQSFYNKENIFLILYLHTILRWRYTFVIFRTFTL